MPGASCDNGWEVYRTCCIHRKPVSCQTVCLIIQRNSSERLAFLIMFGGGPTSACVVIKASALRLFSWTAHKLKFTCVIRNISAGMFL